MIRWAPPARRSADIDGAPPAPLGFDAPLSKRKVLRAVAETGLIGG